jgi:hypothetical protein
MHDALWRSANKLIINASYTSRQHFIAGQTMRDRAKWIGVPNVIVATTAAGGAGVLALVGVDRSWVAAFAFLAAVIGALDNYFKPLAQADAHAIKAARIKSVCEDTEHFRDVGLRSSKTEIDLDKGLKALWKAYQALREDQPRHLPKAAYQRARNEIDDGQAGFENDPLWVDPPAGLGE